jgi:Spy/CpxP family protein refolding chaperone
MKPKVKGVLLLLLVFLLGAASGALGLGLYQARTGWWSARRDSARLQQVLLRRLTRELDLRPDQRQQVEALLRESREEFRRLRVEIRPRFRDIRERTRDRIRGILDPEQQARFEALADRWERQAERRGERPRESGVEPSKTP